MSDTEQLLDTLQAWRDRGYDRFDPVRFRFMEALARRGQTHQAQVQRIVNDKLTRLLAAYGEDSKRASAEGQPSKTSGMAGGQANRTAQSLLLGALVKHLSVQGSTPEELDPAKASAAHHLNGTHELKTLRHFKGLWSRLSADQCLKQAQAKVPHNAGPLNSNQLVHRSLVLMRELSPEYLYQFMSYLDGLSWLEQAQGRPPG